MYSKNKGENNMSIKDEIYTNITQTLGKLDGINKDGIYITIDGKQYNIKVTEKKKPVIFEGMETTTTVSISKAEVLSAIPTIQSSIDEILEACKGE